jgi:hypothetical protein
MIWTLITIGLFFYFGLPVLIFFGGLILIVLCVLGNIYGDDFDVEIRPYLKKVWIVDLDKFRFKFPEREDIVPRKKYMVSKLTGISAN